MNREMIVSLSEQFVKDSPNNYINKESAIDPIYVGMQMFEAPIFAFGAADDEIYDEFKSPDIIDSEFMGPLEWLPEAKTVISLFLPYTDRIKSSNSENFEWPSNEWLHGRYEGQIFLQELVSFLEKILKDSGYKVIVPSVDKAFTYKTINNDGKTKFITNWSERHIAYACGLGTFGLSKGLITEKGVCGRFGSLVTDLDLPKDSRKYSDPYEYCTMCNACVPHCPAGAISPDDGKNSMLCSEFLKVVNKKHDPRYGCGKCQVAVPCESRIPRGDM